MPHLEKLGGPALVLIALICLTGCTPRTTPPLDRVHDTPPSLLLGTFEDDYGITYSISEQVWHQQPDVRYHIVQWHPEGQYLIARNDRANPSDAGLWTRIDWIRLTDMPPYEWAFCLSAYAASTAAQAEKANVVQRDTPRTGCNGFPFSRMRRHPTEQ